MCLVDDSLPSAHPFWDSLSFSSLRRHLTRVAMEASPCLPIFSDEPWQLTVNVWPWCFFCWWFFWLECRSNYFSDFQRDVVKSRNTDSRKEHLLLQLGWIDALPLTLAFENSRYVANFARQIDVDAQWDDDSAKTGRDGSPEYHPEVQSKLLPIAIRWDRSSQLGVYLSPTKRE